MDALIGYLPDAIFPGLWPTPCIYLLYGTAIFFSMTCSKILFPLSEVFPLMKLHISTDCFNDIGNDELMATASIFIYLTDTAALDLVAPIPGAECLTDFLVSANSPK